MSKLDVIVGIQWGDEGKGRVVDLYAVDYDVVARFGGGDNAGHSIVVGDTKLALRIVPSGVLNPKTELFIGGGTVVDPHGLLRELDALSAVGVDVRRVKLSDRAHLVLPSHAARDRVAEIARGQQALGTTARGIGPAYADRAARIGIPAGNLLHPEVLAARVEANLALGRACGADVDMDAASTLAALRAAGERLAPHLVDGVSYLHERLERGERVLAEGAQGTLLDVGYGTYPYVTSSHTLAGGVCTGLGVGPTAVGRVTGIAKAYCTRVGAGPFPSELGDARGERLRVAGGEFGTVTGRPRRCGWFDAVAARYAVRLNGLGAVVLTKLDVLSGFDRLAIVTGYRRGGASVEFSLAGSPDLDIEVEEMPGWTESIGGVSRIADLPSNARRYVARLESLMGVPIEAVSVGPERSQIAR
ncbi:MAG: adenylosuccinate synthase [Vulcanimicrobiaceae bacterium]